MEPQESEQRQRTRKEILSDGRSCRINLSHGETLIIEILLDIRAQNEQIIKLLEKGENPNIQLAEMGYLTDEDKKALGIKVEKLKTEKE
ncbi:MAG: hypothetical protein PHZ02_01350 [Desulfocapsaceae bacterium]|nr:hypothetical protein [Desulfocapsaceae bacterium]